MLSIKHCIAIEYDFFFTLSSFSLSIRSWSCSWRSNEDGPDPSCGRHLAGVSAAGAGGAEDQDWLGGWILFRGYFFFAGAHFLRALGLL